MAPPRASPAMTRFSPWESCTIAILRYRGSLERGELSLATPRNHVVPDFATAAASRWIGPMLHQQADASYRPHSTNNEFGLDNEKWDAQTSPGNGPATKHSVGVNLFFEHSNETRNGSTWSFSCAS